jgi:hypothetical protein
MQEVSTWTIPRMYGAFARMVTERREEEGPNHERVIVMRLTIFAPQDSLSREMYLKVWRSLCESRDFYCHLPDVCAGDCPTKVIDRLHSYNIMGTSVRREEHSITFYFSGRTMDETLILMEIVVENRPQGQGQGQGLLRYRTDQAQRDTGFETFIQDVLASRMPEVPLLNDKPCPELCTGRFDFVEEKEPC